MDIQIFTPELALAGVCDKAVSVTATESFLSPGSCTLTVPLKMASAFPLQGMMSIPGIGGGYLIESVREDTAAGIASIEGQGILSLFSHRILPDGFTYSGEAEDALTGLADTYGASALPGNLCCISYGIPRTVEIAARAASLLDVMSSVARQADLGLHLRLDTTAREFLFSVRQKQNRGRFLSRSLGNLLRAARRQDMSTYANQVTVLGRGGKRVILSAADHFHDGFDDSAAPKREYLCSAKDILPSEYKTDAEYLAALTEVGMRELSQRRPRFSASLRVDEDTAREVTPGEICPLSDPWLGRYSAAVCTKKTMTWDKTGSRYSISLSLIPNTQVS